MINYETIVQPQEFTVEQIFNNNEYVIPIYQRNYAWSRLEIEQLLDDINDIDIQETKKYYLGSLIVNERGINCFEVIDGQQRLTTLYLILKSLGRDVSNKLTYRSRMRSNETIKNLYRQEIDNPDVGILRGFKVAQHAIKEIVDEDKRVEFTAKTYDDFNQIIYKKIPKEIFDEKICPTHIDTIFSSFLSGMRL